MTSHSNQPQTLSSKDVLPRLVKLGLYGLARNIDQVVDKPWLPEVLALEETERHKRSLDRRLQNAKNGAFKPIADLD